MAGEILKKRREDLGRNIQEIADLLKIRADCIRSIEEDAFEKLPAPVYTIGYIRCYAKYLGIDADPIVEYYSKNLSQPGPSTIIPIAFSQKKSPKIAYAFFAVLVVIAALLFAVYFRYMPANSASVAPVKPEAVEPAPVRPAGVPEKAAAVAPEVQAYGAPSDGATPETAGAAPAVPAAAAETGRAASETHSLEISATEESWMRLRFPDGKSEEVLLFPGDSRTWSFSGKMTLRIGNAGGVRINLDGKSLERPGGRGQVVTLALPSQ